MSYTITIPIIEHEESIFSELLETFLVYHQGSFKYTITKGEILKPATEDYPGINACNITITEDAKAYEFFLVIANTKILYLYNLLDREDPRNLELGNYYQEFLSTIIVPPYKEVIREVGDKKELVSIDYLEGLIESEESREIRLGYTASGRALRIKCESLVGFIYAEQRGIKRSEEAKIMRAQEESRLRKLHAEWKEAQIKLGEPVKPSPTQYSPPPVKEIFAHVVVTKEELERRRIEREENLQKMHDRLVLSEQREIHEEHEVRLEKALESKFPPGLLWKVEAVESRALQLARRLVTQESRAPQLARRLVTQDENQEAFARELDACGDDISKMLDVVELHTLPPQPKQASSWLSWPFSSPKIEKRKPVLQIKSCAEPSVRRLKDEWDEVVWDTSPNRIPEKVSNELPASPKSTSSYSDTSVRTPSRSVYAARKKEVDDLLGAIGSNEATQADVCSSRAAISPLPLEDCTNTTNKRGIEAVDCDKNDTAEKLSQRRRFAHPAFLPKTGFVEHLEYPEEIGMGR